MSLANKLTITRVLFIPAIMFFLLSRSVQPEGVIIAAGLFGIAAITDTVDGYLARTQKTVTRLGKFMDPLADKLLVSAALVSLVQLGKVSAWVAMVIIAREFIVTGLRLVAAAENIVIPASSWGKAKTVSQVLAIIGIMLVSERLQTAFAGVNIILAIAVVITIVSGIDYFMQARKQLNN